MKKLIFITLLFVSSLYATLVNVYPSQELLDKKIPIVDIRTPTEWKETGVLKGAIPIMFFNESGNYDVNAWLKELNEKVDTTKEFALICHVGNRTQIVSSFLSEKLGYKVINLLGGMNYAQAQNLPILPYKK